MPTRRLFFSFAALALLLTIAQGCGSSEGGTASTAGAQTSEAPAQLPVVITAAEVDRYKAGSLERTTLEWWRTVQDNDPELARSFYAAPPSLPNLAGQFNFVAGQLDGSVEIVSVRQKDSKATVAVKWNKPGQPPRHATLRFKELGGSWKLADTYFLDLIVAQLQESAAGGQGSAPAGE